uniref:type II secretion system F family protein n=1 Tax=Eggerthella sinensis TaxID=242230 RepID=UPI0022E3265D
RLLLGNRGVERLVREAVQVAAERLVREAVQVAADRAWTTTEESLASVCVAALTGAVLGAGVVAGSLVAGLAVAACICVCAAVWLRTVQDKRREAMREAVPDALRSMGVCFQSGLSLLQTFQQVASEVQEPLGALFARAAHRLETGESAEQALEVLRGGSTVPELAFVAVALDVQHQAGGSMKQVLDAALDTVENEIELRRSLRVQTAQAKLSARVVSVLPFVLIAVFSLVSEGFLAPFFASPLGLALLALAWACRRRALRGAAHAGRGGGLNDGDGSCACDGGRWRRAAGRFVLAKARCAHAAGSAEKGGRHAKRARGTGARGFRGRPQPKAVARRHRCADGSHAARSARSVVFRAGETGRPRARRVPRRVLRSRRAAHVRRRRGGVCSGGAIFSTELAVVRLMCAGAVAGCARGARSSRRSSPCSVSLRARRAARWPCRAR